MALLWTLLLLRVNCVAGASILFNGFRFTFSTEGVNGGFRIGFKCPIDKFCGMIVSQSTTPEVFTFGDTYILARHGLCDYDCCFNLRGNPPPDYSCPHPRCCTSTGSPVGLRSFPSLMGEGWSTQPHTILFPHGCAPRLEPLRQISSPCDVLRGGHGARHCRVPNP